MKRWGLRRQGGARAIARELEQLVFTEAEPDQSIGRQLRLLKQYLAAQRVQLIYAHRSGGRLHAMSTGRDASHAWPRNDYRLTVEWLAEHKQTAVWRDELPANSALERLIASHQVSGVVLVDTNPASLLLIEATQKQMSTVRRRLTPLERSARQALRSSLLLHRARYALHTAEYRAQSAEAKLAQSTVRAQTLDATKDEFLSIASHQLRTPLTSIKGYLSMVLEGDTGSITPMQRKVLAEAFDSSERMVHLIHDFLNVSRLQTGKFSIEYNDCDLITLTKHEISKLRQSAKSRHISFKFLSSLKTASIFADEVKLQQVVMNFLDNALFYSTEKSTVTITISERNDGYELRVTDQGIGVPTTEKSQLFGKFFRASNAKQHRPDGTGVGLYVAKKVIDGHGGTIIFESSLNNGSTFGFWLPKQPKTPA